MAAFASTRTFFSGLLEGLGGFWTTCWTQTQQLLWFSQNRRIWLALQRNSAKSWRVQCYTYAFIKQKHGTLSTSREQESSPAHHQNVGEDLWHPDWRTSTGLTVPVECQPLPDTLRTLDICHTCCPSCSDLDSLLHKPARMKKPSLNMDFYYLLLIYSSSTKLHNCDGNSIHGHSFRFFFCRICVGID